MATTQVGSKTATGRKVADCRLFPSEKNCSLTIAGTEDEVLEVAVHHAVTSHGHKNSPELRNQIRAMLKEEA
jgi:predicted small metal-binding protein